MRLFHVSEESDIQIFYPRLPSRSDLDPGTGLVWTVCERTLPNFLTPRDCPRVTYHIHTGTSAEDIEKYTVPGISHVVVIESGWLETMKNTVLYLYEFNLSDFYLQDACAGYYVSETPQKPIDKIIIKDSLSELAKQNTELRVTDNLWDICDKIKQTSFNWSMCRMKNALNREV